jgi:hypothetical protein
VARVPAAAAAATGGSVSAATSTASSVSARGGQPTQRTRVSQQRTKHARRQNRLAALSMHGGMCVRWTVLESRHAWGQDEFFEMAYLAAKQGVTGPWRGAQGECISSISCVSYATGKRWVWMVFSSREGGAHAPPLPQRHDEHA